MKNGKPNRSEVESGIRKSLAKMDNETPTWDDILEAGQIKSEGGIPVQDRRHLISSWAGAQMGFNLTVKRLKDTIQKLLTSEIGHLQKTDDVRDSLQTRSDRVGELENENLVFRGAEYAVKHMPQEAIPGLLEELRSDS